MRYFIFLLCVLCTSCGLSNRHTVGQEKTLVIKDTVRAKTVHTEPVAESRVVIDTIPGLAGAEAAYVFDPNMMAISYSENPSWLRLMGPTSFSSYIISSGTPHITCTVDSTFFLTATSADTISAKPVKLIPKSTASILPEPQSSMMPYIASGIAAIILSTLFFALVKRVRKTK